MDIFDIYFGNIFYYKYDLFIRDFIQLYNCKGGACVMVIVVGNGHGDTSSNPGRD